MNYKYEQMLMHDISLSDTYVNTHFDFRIDDQALSKSATERIFDYAQRLAQDKDIAVGNDLWSIIGKHHQELIETCIRRNYEDFWRITKAISKTSNVVGFMNQFPYSKLESIEECRQIDAYHCIDKLISLAECLAVVPVLNPEQGGWQVVDPDFVPYFKSAFKCNGAVIPPPPAGGGAFGIKTNLGVYSPKDLVGRCTGGQVVNLCKLHALDRIHEIGGGLGFVAYYAAKLGNFPYALFDLPAVSIMQAHFLMRSLGEENVYLDGEQEAHERGVLLRPFWRIAAEGKSNVLWLNQDSLPEIYFNIGKSFISKISSTRRGFFLSINQESTANNWLGGEQHRVPDLIADEKGLIRQYRCRDFMRLGYVEELYVIGNT